MTILKYVPFVIISMLVAIYNLQNLKQKPSITAGIVRLSFIVYAISVFYLIFTPGVYSFGSELYSHAIHIGYAKVIMTPYQDYGMQGMLNIVMTVPMGVYLYIFGHKDRPLLIEVLLIALGFALFNEGGQFALDQVVHLNRTVDVMDVIHNAAGVVIGFYLMSPFNLFLKTEKNDLQKSKL